MFSLQSNSTGWALWLRWVLLNLIGWLIMYLLGWLIRFPDDETFYSMYLPFLWLVMGAIIAFMQWLAVRHWIKNPSWWIVAVSLGFVAALNVSAPMLLWDKYVDLSAMRLNSHFQMENVYIGVVFGMILGYAQWLALRRTFSSSGLWIIGSIVAWTLARFIVEIIPFDWNWSGTSIVHEGLLNSIVAAMTGFVLVRIIDRSRDVKTVR